MLSSLFVKDFAIVSEVELQLDQGLTVISGETGAGKSLLVDALLLLTGARADASAVRHGAERAELSATFRLPDHSPALAWLREQELDEDGECALRRIVRADGGSKTWINGRPRARTIPSRGPSREGTRGESSTCSRRKASGNARRCATRRRRRPRRARGSR